MKTLKFTFILLFLALVNYAQLNSQDSTAKDEIRGMDLVKFNKLKLVDELLKNDTTGNQLIYLWEDVELFYQRRTGIIENLVRYLQGTNDFDRVALSNVIDAKEKTTYSVIVDGKITSKKLIQFQVEQESLNSSLSNFLVSIKKYPNLLTNQNFSLTLVQLEGVEYRIDSAEKDFYTLINELNSIKK